MLTSLKKLVFTLIPFLVASLIPLFLVPLASSELPSEVTLEYFNFEVYSGLFLVISDFGLVQKSLKALVDEESPNQLLEINGQILARILILALAIPIILILFEDIVILYGLLNSMVLLLLSPWIYHFIGNYARHALLPTLLKAILLVLSIFYGKFFFGLYFILAFIVAGLVFARRGGFKRPELLWKFEKDNITITAADFLTWIYSSSPILILQRLSLPSDDIVSFGLINKLSKAVKAAVRPVIAAFMGKMKNVCISSVSYKLFVILLCIYLLFEVVLMKNLSTVVFGEISLAIWYMRFTLYLTVLGSLNLIVGFGISTTRGNFNIKLRQALLGVTSYIILGLGLLVNASVLSMCLILMISEIVILVDYAKKSSSHRRLNAQRS